MIRSIIFSIILTVFSSFVWMHSTMEKEAIPLDVALAKGMVKLEPTGVGGYSGKCLEMKMTNLSKSKLSVLIPAGAVFHPEDESMQDIFVVEDQILAMEKGATICRPVSGFCCQSHDRSPSAGTKFSLGKMENSKLLELASFLNKNKFDEGVTQSAVWCVADNSSVGDIYSEDRQKIQPLRELICKITGQKDVWFATARNNVVNDEGYIQREPVSVSGMIAFTVDAPVSIKAKVKGKDNGKEYDMPGEITAPRAGKFEYDFQLRVRGWDKGKYEVIVMAGTRELLRQDFEL